MREEIDLVVVAEEKSKAGGLSLAVIVSLVLHVFSIIWIVTSYRPAPPAAQNVPIARYVELMKQNPREFVEAPGPAVDRAPLNAPLSDKNRRASMPEPTGLTPTTRPGDGRDIYTPPMGAPAPRPAQQAQRPNAAQQAQQGQQPVESNATPAEAINDTFIYRDTRATARASAAAPGIDWRSAIKGVKSPVGSGDDSGLTAPGGGGERGLAEQGPLSFETSWFEWGDYAQSMVSRIRVNWYANMPQLIRTGIAGVVTIRFTIQRNGSITDVTILKSSGHPPYDYAARKAIELSSPLNALPREFPNPNERVTAMFYYNRAVD